VENATTRRFGGDASGETGTALVEMAFVIVLLSLVLFGIVTFGYLLSFKQNLTQAATEAARAGAVATGSVAVREDAAHAAADQALSSFGQQCGVGGMHCIFTADVSCPEAASGFCVSVRLQYDYASYPLLPVMPLLGSAIPDTITASASAETSA
jgi:Flp pilus assembly protein TadG